MRRRPSAPQLSPQLIKQFAIVTLIITGLLGMFASGERNELEQQLADRVARNRALAAEAQTIGTRKLFVAPAADDSAGDSGWVAPSESGPASASPVSAGGSMAPPPPPEIVLEDRGRDIVVIERGPDGKPRQVLKPKPKRPPIDPKDRERALEESRRRAGAATAAD